MLVVFSILCGLLGCLVLWGTEKLLDWKYGPGSGGPIQERREIQYTKH